MNLIGQRVRHKALFEKVNKEGVIINDLAKEIKVTVKFDEKEKDFVYTAFKQGFLTFVDEDKKVIEHLDQCICAYDNKKNESEHIDLDDEEFITLEGQTNEIAIATSELIRLSNSSSADIIRAKEEKVLKLKLLILAKIVHKYGGYRIFAIDTDTRIILRIISNGKDEYIYSGCVDQNSLLSKYGKGYCFEAEVCAPVAYNGIVYFPINENCIQFISKENEHDYMQTNRKPDELYSDISSCDESADAYNGLELLNVKGSKILKHLKKDNVFQLRMFSDKKTDYLSVINDKQFCKSKYLNKKLEGYALVEFCKSKSKKYLYDFFIQALSCKVLSEEEYQKRKIDKEESAIKKYPMSPNLGEAPQWEDDYDLSPCEMTPFERLNYESDSEEYCYYDEDENDEYNSEYDESYHFGMDREECFYDEDECCGLDMEEKSNSEETLVTDANSSSDSALSESNSELPQCTFVFDDNHTL